MHTQHCMCTDIIPRMMSTVIHVFIIREVNGGFDGEQDMTKLITFMIDTDNVKVRCIQ